MLAAERIDDLLNLFVVRTLRHGVLNPGALHTQRLTRAWQHVLILVTF